MKKILLIALLMMFAVAGCSKAEDDHKRPSTFPQLNGVYKGRSSLFSYRWEFDDTNIAHRTIWNWNSTLKTWTHFDGDMYVWEVSGSDFRIKMWNNEYAEYSSSKFVFIDQEAFKLSDVTFLIAENKSVSKTIDHPHLIGTYTNTGKVTKESWIFDGTNQAVKRRWSWVGSSSTWREELFSPEYLEWKVIDDTLYTRPWNKKDSYSAEGSIKFVDEDNFEIYAHLYTRE